MIKTKAQISISIDDGHPLDIKAAEILAKKNIKTTFYISIKNSTGRPTLKKEQIRFLSQHNNFIIGSHTYNHVNLTNTSLSRAEEEIRSGKEALEDIIGKEVSTFAWPWGKYNSKLVLLAKKIGIKDCRGVSLINFKSINKRHFLWFPNFYITKISLIREIRNIGKRLDWYSFILRCRYIYLPHHKLISVFKKLDGEFHFWFHSWEIEKLNLWEVINEL